MNHQWSLWLPLTTKVASIGSNVSFMSYVTKYCKCWRNAKLTIIMQPLIDKYMEDTINKYRIVLAIVFDVVVHVQVFSIYIIYFYYGSQTHSDCYLYKIADEILIQKYNFNSEDFLPHIWHPSRFNQNNWKPVICHSWWTNPSTYVTRKCQICEQGMYDDHRISINARYPKIFN